MFKIILAWVVYKIYFFVIWLFSLTKFISLEYRETAKLILLCFLIWVGWRILRFFLFDLANIVRPKIHRFLFWLFYLKLLGGFFDFCWWIKWRWQICRRNCARKKLAKTNPNYIYGGIKAQR